MINSFDVQKQTPEPEHTPGDDILLASEAAYTSLSEKGYQGEVHRLSVCYQASALIVSSLIENGYRAEHEIRVGMTVPEHSFVTVDNELGNELIIDPTWQQFLPKDKITSDMPRVLFGSRDEVIARARFFGLDEETLKIYGPEAQKLSVEDQKHVDNDATAAADLADSSGAWEKFMGQGR